MAQTDSNNEINGGPKSRWTVPLHCFLFSVDRRINADDQLCVGVPLWQLQLSAEQHEAGLCPRHHPRREQVSQRAPGQGQQPGHAHPPPPPPPPPSTTSADSTQVHSVHSAVNK